MTLQTRLSVASMVLLCGAACGGESGDGTGSGTTAEPTTTSDATTAPATTGGESTGAPTTGTTDGTTGDDGPEVPAAYEKWLKVEVPGTVCGNGSQYKFFVNYKEGAEDLLVMLEPGGACWDYAGCSGKTDLGAAHPDGIPDDLMKITGPTASISPLIRRDLEGPTKDFNMVFLPYCTGDVHTGNNVITYTDPEGVGPDLEFHHAGHANILGASAWMAKQFPATDRLFVTGCSAGGAGSLINYHFLRSKISAKRGYMMNDAGPIYPSSGFSNLLHTKIRSSWNVDPILEELPPGYPVTDDFGVLNTHLADLYPNDRLSTVYFQRDYNFSRYSYENFYDANAKADIMTYWASDTELLVDLYETRPNLGYYLPYWREFNSSHCASIASYLDTDIEEFNMDLSDYIAELFDDKVPIGRYMESVQPEEDN
jgi:hypothetical protein